VGQEFGVEATAVVADADLNGAISAVGPNGDRRGAVFGCVVDEVADDSIEVVWVDANLLGRRAIHCELVTDGVSIAIGDGV
jgi:hypothetical protein